STGTGTTTAAIPGTTTGSTGGQERAVAIAQFMFDPASLAVQAGGRVVWTNQDGAMHTVTADDGSFDSGTLAQGATFRHTFAAAGTLDYHCSIHPSMQGRIVVQ
ncbi:MAG TPA: cupredoxin family copper-binding protein, partial [Candidatus Thermoplasmatota archaeon]|nr:cupredoxin family copper-binding protein [Candidatus Thermoplasmatota archaeon]